jgi:hypothetical protein
MSETVDFNQKSHLHKEEKPENFETTKMMKRLRWKFWAVQL